MWKLRNKTSLELGLSHPLPQGLSWCGFSQKQILSKDLGLGHPHGRWSRGKKGVVEAPELIFTLLEDFAKPSYIFASPRRWELVVATVAAVISSRSRLQKVLISSASCRFRQRDAHAEYWQALKKQRQRSSSSVPTRSPMLPFESWTKWDTTRVLNRKWALWNVLPACLWDRHTLMCETVWVEWKGSERVLHQALFVWLWEKGRKLLGD